jgi:hypothetical protein
METLAPLLPRAVLQAIVDCGFRGDELAPVVIEPTAPHTHTYVHCVEFFGRASAPWYVHSIQGGSAEQDQARIFREVMAPRLPSIRWIILSPPKVRNSFIEKEWGKKPLRVPSWYNFATMGVTERGDLSSQCDGVRRLSDAVEREIKANGTSPSQIIVSGFSSGGVIALLYAQLQTTVPELDEGALGRVPLRRVGGLVGWSTFTGGTEMIYHAEHGLVWAAPPLAPGRVADLPVLM